MASVGCLEPHPSFADEILPVELLVAVEHGGGLLRSSLVMRGLVGVVGQPEVSAGAGGDGSVRGL